MVIIHYLSSRKDERDYRWKPFHCTVVLVLTPWEQTVAYPLDQQSVKDHVQSVGPTGLKCIPHLSHLLAAVRPQSNVRKGPLSHQS